MRIVPPLPEWYACYAAPRAGSRTKTIMRCLKSVSVFVCERAAGEYANYVFLTVTALRAHNYQIYTDTCNSAEHFERIVYEKKLSVPYAVNASIIQK